IEEMSDRIGIMEAGRLVVDGDIQSLRAHHSPKRKVVRLRVEPQEMSRTAELLAGLVGGRSGARRDRCLGGASDEPNCNFVLAELLRHQLHILEFAEDEPDLEEIFMRSTAGKVT